MIINKLFNPLRVSVFIFLAILGFAQGQKYLTLFRVLGPKVPGTLILLTPDKIGGIITDNALEP